MRAYYQQEEGRPSFLWLLGNGSRFAVSVSSETPKDTHKTLANSLLLALAKEQASPRLITEGGKKIDDDVICQSGFSPFDGQFNLWKRDVLN